MTSISRCLRALAGMQRKARARWGGGGACAARHMAADQTVAGKGVMPGARCIWMRQAVGFGVTVFLGREAGHQRAGQPGGFRAGGQAIPEVQTVEHVLGLYDYRLRVVARDLPTSSGSCGGGIMTLPGAGEVEANVLLTEERRPGPL